jgi:hypothetical protein
MNKAVVDVLIKVLAAFEIEKISVRIDGANVTIMFPLDGNWRLSPSSASPRVPAVEDHDALRRSLRSLEMANADQSTIASVEQLALSEWAWETIHGAPRRR